MLLSPLPLAWLSAEDVDAAGKAVGILLEKSISPLLGVVLVFDVPTEECTTLSLLKALSQPVDDCPPPPLPPAENKSPPEGTHVAIVW